MSVFTPGAPYEPVAVTPRDRTSDSEMTARAQEYLDEISARQTIRDYVSDPVPRSVIETCIRAAGQAPSGANHQPWHFAVIGDAELKRQVREAAEAEERAFYNGKGSEEWLAALSPLGTDPAKPFLEIAPWLIVVFAERYGEDAKGQRYKNYYISESVGIACGFLISALHHAGLSTLTHTPNPMRFLNDVCKRPDRERPFLILVAGHPAADAAVPKKSLLKKPLDEIASFL
ncbi:MAG: nitroreductase family protein [Alphaproteobacteria bacterium]|nr:nitroreductase family protein [Alphaproteobacteria bacterium]